MATFSQTRFRIALAASVVLHAVLLAGLPGLPRDPPAANTLLEARLEPAPAPVPPPEPPPAAPKVVPLEPAAKPAPARQPVTTTQAPGPVAVEQGVPEPPAATAAATPDPAPSTREPPAAAPPDPPPVAEAPRPEPPQPPSPPARRLPRRLAITYDLYMGTDRFSIGRTLQQWEADDGRYKLSSRSETTGMAGLFRPYQLGYSSEGVLLANGLQPERFAVRRGRSGEQQLEARFDWRAMTLALGQPGAPRQVPLTAGTLDLVSFVFQLALTELAPGRLRLQITNGSKVDNYELEVGPAEPLDTPLGALRALPVRQVRTPGQESMEVWLAPELRQLPVRIRFLDRDGNMSGEQVAREIRIDAE